MWIILWSNAKDSQNNLFRACRCRSISDSVTNVINERFLKLILCTIKLMSQHFLCHPQTIQSLFC